MEEKEAEAIIPNNGWTEIITLINQKEEQMIAILKKLFTKEEKPFNPRTATLEEWERLEEQIEKTGRELDYTRKYWGHNIEMRTDYVDGLVKGCFVFSQRGLRVGDIILDNYTKGTAKLLVLHCKPSRYPSDLYYVYTCIVGYKEREA